MEYRTLGKTGIRVSAISFGAGPVSTLMVGDDAVRQRAVIGHAIKCGINWFDTAATYGDGQSELSLGRALAELGAASRVHVATKVRLAADDFVDIGGAIRRSFASSLERLRRSRVTLLQLHNSITERRGEEPTSITPTDILERNGVAESFEELRSEGLVSHLGLAGIGHPAALREVVNSGRFETIQVPYHLLNPSAGQAMPADFCETNYGNIIADSAKMGLGVFAIRVLAGGALANNEPSPHTLKTPFFPLALYERDRERAANLQRRLGPERPLARQAIRFPLEHSHIASAIIGFGTTGQIDQALEATADTSHPIDTDEVR